MKKQGKIIVVVGCMFSGKNRLVAELVKKFKKRGLGTCFFKASCDTRSGKHIVVRGVGRVLASVVDGQKPKQILYQVKGDVVVIDEGHFFHQRIIDVLEELREKGKIVIITGLDTDFKGRPFHPVPGIIAIADQRFFPKMARCAVCGKVASRTQKLNSDGTPAGDNSPLLDSGGEKAGDRYEPRCRRCHQPPKRSK